MKRNALPNPSTSSSPGTRSTSRPLIAFESTAAASGPQHSVLSGALIPSMRTVVGTPFTETVRVSPSVISVTVPTTRSSTGGSVGVVVVTASLPGRVVVVVLETTNSGACGRESHAAPSMTTTRMSALHERFSIPER